MLKTQQKNKILFADDEAICHTLAQLIVSQVEGMSLIEAFTGEEAVQLAKENANEIKVIFLDVMLPDIDGYEVFRQLKKDPKCSEIPIVFQTGLVSQNDIVKQTLDKNAKIIYKPYNQNDFIRFISETHS